MRYRAIFTRRGALVACGVLAASALLAAGFLALRGTGKAAPRAGAADTQAGSRTCAAPALAPLCSQPAVTAASALAAPAAPPVRRRSGRAARRVRPRVPGQTATPAPGPAAAQVLALINQARAQSGLPAYTITAGLDGSAAAHDARMAGGCGLSHQCPGEPALGARETAAGVQWTAAGENIGEGGPVQASAAAIGQMAVTLTQAMLNEKPPADGHRMNILSTTFRHIGIAVYRDSSGTVWLTQDFSN